MDFKTKVIEAIINNLPEIGGVDLGFFLDPTTFPIGSDLGENRTNWHLAFSWLDGLGITTQELEVVPFEYDFNKSKFEGVFKLQDQRIEVLGDFEPLRRVNDEELAFITSQLPERCKMFAVGVHRPSTRREVRGVDTLFLDAVVAYYAWQMKRVPNPLQLLATAPSTQPNQA